MILKGGGCNGSGKTTLARAFMKLWDFVPFTASQIACSSVSGTWPLEAQSQLLGTSKTKVLEYRAVPKKGQPLFGWFNKIVVLGSYETVCGGLDTVSGKDLRLALVEQYCGEPKTLVLGEGVLVGVTFGAMGELSLRSKVPWIYWFMDTPYEECVKRVEARRVAKGNTVPFDGMKSLYPKIRACESVARRAEAAGQTVVWIDHLIPAHEQVRGLLRQVEKLKG